LMVELLEHELESTVMRIHTWREQWFTA
jgi:hypothetical protein